ncbi:NYNRIN-like protein, partial [Clarias magur]
PIPAELTTDEYDDAVSFTKPNEIIAITSVLPVPRESVCGSELADDKFLAIYAVSTQLEKGLP